MNRIDAGKLVVGGVTVSSKPELIRSEHDIRSTLSIPPATVSDNDSLKEQVKKSKGSRKSAYMSDMISLDNE